MAINANKRRKTLASSSLSTSFLSSYSFLQRFNPADLLTPPNCGGFGGGDEDDVDNTTVSQLESTITVEKSPVQKKGRQQRRNSSPKRRRTSLKQVVLNLPAKQLTANTKTKTTTATTSSKWIGIPSTTTSAAVVTTTTPTPITLNATTNEFDLHSIQEVESQGIENLTCQISEVDTQDQQQLRRVGHSPSKSRTGGGGIGLSDEIEEVDSTELGTRNETPRGTQASGDAGSGQEGKSLLERFKVIKSKHDAKVRLFGHDYRNGKYNDVESLELVVRKVIDRHDKMVKAVAYDLTESRDKWVTFKSADPYEIVDGVCVKLFRPWQEISIAGCNDRMIVGADFFKIFRGSNFNLNKQQISEILSLALPKPSELRVPRPLFMDLVPFRIKNRRTVRKQLCECKNFLDIDVVILNVWKFQFRTIPALCLIKDSDEFLAFLEVPKTFKGLIATVVPGTYVKLTNLAVHQKVRISERLAPFSVIRLFGAKQSYFFTLRMEKRSRFELLNELDIPISNPSQNFLTMDEIDMASTILDCRITLKCKLTEKGRQHVLVRDLESDRSLMINFVFESGFCVDDICPRRNERIILKFLRLIHGKAIWDYFTTCEKLTEEE